MKRTFTFLIALAFSGYLFSQSISPDVVAAAGDYFSNGTISISWTLGEVATETIGNGTYTLTQGFQQPNYLITAVPKYPQRRMVAFAFCVLDTIAINAISVKIFVFIFFIFMRLLCLPFSAYGFVDGIKILN